MTSYEMMKQDLPAYEQPAVPGYQQQVVVPPPNAVGIHPANELRSNSDGPPQSRRFTRNNAAEENDTTAEDEDKEILGPGDIHHKALDLEFDKCFHEHKSTKTFDQLNLCLGITYKYTKLVIYHIFVFLIGIPMAILWAILNGIMVFILVWIYQPAMRVTVMWVYAVAPLATAPIQAILTPLVDVSARIFRQIRVKANLEGSFAERLARGNQTQSV